MTSAVVRPLRTHGEVRGDIAGNENYVRLGVWKAVHATPELEVECKHVLELAKVRQDRHV